jgi:hypothetical protein
MDTACLSKRSEEILAMNPAECLYAYQGTLSSYINDNLRDGPWHEIAKIEVPHLTSSIDQLVKPSTEPMTLWRGVGLDPEGRLPQVGDIVSDAAYLSTSLAREIAETFAPRRYSMPALWRIEARAGTGMIDVEQVCVELWPNNSGMAKREQERLLARGTELVIEQIGQWHHGLLITARTQIG